MNKVNVFLIGAQKCGTTTLTKIFGKHPEISIPILKEPNFFSIGTLNINEYHSNYNFNKLIQVDASTTYSMKHRYPDVARKIHEYNPGAKILYLVRNPIDRIVSHYNFQLAKGYDLNESDILKNDHFISTSLYHYQINDFIRYFGKKNVCIINFHQLIVNPSNVLRDVYRFLEIGFVSIPFAHENETVGLKRVPARKFKRAVRLPIVSTVLALHPKLHGLFKRLYKIFRSVEVDRKMYLSNDLRKELNKRIVTDLQKFEAQFGINISSN